VDSSPYEEWKDIFRPGQADFTYQAKYGILARGEVTLYLRVPSSSEPGYKENIWDHAAGSIIAEEAGGKVTDALGHVTRYTHNSFNKVATVEMAPQEPLITFSYDGRGNLRSVSIKTSS
jgi:3'-phosphoadenosine 5'-phosphosulfate (PAPS) 3'-phosphatase